MEDKEWTEKVTVSVAAAQEMYVSGAAVLSEPGDIFMWEQPPKNVTEDFSL